MALEADCFQVGRLLYYQELQGVLEKEEMDRLKEEQEQGRKLAEAREAREKDLRSKGLIK